MFERERVEKLFIYACPLDINYDIVLRSFILYIIYNSSFKLLQCFNVIKILLFGNLLHQIGPAKNTRKHFGNA